MEHADTPLWPAGHLPLKGGDRIDAIAEFYNLVIFRMGQRGQRSSAVRGAVSVDAPIIRSLATGEHAGGSRSPTLRAVQLHMAFERRTKLAPSSPQRGEGGPQGRMRGARSAKAVPGSPLIASHTLGTSPRGEKREPGTATGVPDAALPLRGRCPLGQRGVTHTLTPPESPIDHREPSCICS
jgi:hypothetical protein